MADVERRRTTLSTTWPRHVVDSVPQWVLHYLSRTNRRCMIWLIPHLLQSLSSTGHTEEDWEIETTCWRKMGGGGGGEIIRRRESLILYKSFNTLWCKWYKVLPQVASPTSKSSRSDSRTSFGSIFETPAKEKSSERVSLSHKFDRPAKRYWIYPIDYLYSSCDEFKDNYVLLSYFRLNSWHWLYSTYVDLLWEIIMRGSWMCNVYLLSCCEEPHLPMHYERKTSRPRI